jgi:hypothetical protein
MLKLISIFGNASMGKYLLLLEVGLGLQHYVLHYLSYFQACMLALFLGNLLPDSGGREHSL